MYALMRTPQSAWMGLLRVKSACCSSRPSAAELKEQEIAHNKAAAAEAAQRKERRRQAQEKKRVQKAQRAELQTKVQHVLSFLWSQIYS